MMRAMALLLCLTAPGFAQTQVDAVVTDKDGRRIPDLTVADFTVFQDGKPHPVTQFSYVREQPEDRTVILVDDLNADPRPQLARFSGRATIVYLSRRSGAHLDRALDFVHPPTPFLTLLGDIPLVRELHETLTNLGDLPGRKTLVVVAPAPRGAHALDVPVLAEIANFATVAVYHLGGSENLSALADATGGWTVRQLDDAIAPAPYYRIGWDAASPHRFQIRTRDKKLQVHARERFLLPDPPPKSHPPAVPEQMRRALTSPLGGGDLDVT